MVKPEFFRVNYFRIYCVQNETMRMRRSVEMRRQIQLIEAKNVNVIELN